MSDRGHLNPSCISNVSRGMGGGVISHGINRTSVVFEIPFHTTYRQGGPASPLLPRDGGERRMTTTPLCKVFGTSDSPLQRAPFFRTPRRPADEPRADAEYDGSINACVECVKIMAEGIPAVVVTEAP